MDDLSAASVAAQIPSDSAASEGILGHTTNIGVEVAQPPGRNACDTHSEREVPWRDILPTELWCCIWQHLPLGDRVSITQVCGGWRELALHTSTLWTRLDFYTTRHHPHCARADWEGHKYQPGWVDNPYPANSSNEGLIQRVLELSGDLELELALDVVPYFCEFGVLIPLALALGSHSARIAHITCVTGDPEAIAYFLFNFDFLPALRTIRMFPAPGCDAWLESHDAPSMGLLVRHISLPRLELLDISRMPAVLWPMGEPQNFPALWSLALHVGRMKNLVYALRACPAVTSLHVIVDIEAADGRRACDWNDWRQADTDEILQSLTTCRVDGLSAIDERGQLLAAFLNPGRPKLTLIYLDFPRDKGFGILREVGLSTSSNIRIVATECGGVVMLRTDSAGRRRQLMFPAKDPVLKQRVFKRIWADETLLAHVRHISLNDSMWASFLSSVPPDNHLARIDLIVNTAGTLSALIVANFSSAVRLPCLTFLSVFVDHGEDIPPVPSAAEILSFVRSIGSPLPLSTLVLDRTLMPNEPFPAPPETFALRIHIY